MVVARWRRLTRAARWNGQAHHTTTGVARARLTQSDPGNIRAGTMPSKITGIANTAAHPSRRRRATSGSGRAAAASAAGRGVAPGAVAAAAGRRTPPIASPSTGPDGATGGGGGAAVGAPGLAR
jgi:hypothetical protein